MLASSILLYAALVIIVVPVLLLTPIGVHEVSKKVYI
jgi:hypothetical protein